MAFAGGYRISNFIEWRPEMIPEATRKLHSLLDEIIARDYVEQDEYMRMLFIRHVFPVGTLIPMLHGYQQVVTGYAFDGLAVVTRPRHVIRESMFKSHPNPLIGKYIVAPDGECTVTFYEDLLNVFMVLLYPYAQEGES